MLLYCGYALRQRHINDSVAAPPLLWIKYTLLFSDYFLRAGALWLALGDGMGFRREMTSDSGLGGGEVDHR